MATIVTADETHIRAAQGGSVIRFTFDVKPRAGEPFRAETQAAVADQSRANTLLDNRYTSGTIHLVIQSKSRWIPLHKII